MYDNGVRKHEHGKESLEEDVTGEVVSSCRHKWNLYLESYLDDVDKADDAKFERTCVVCGVKQTITVFCSSKKVAEWKDAE